MAHSVTPLNRSIKRPHTKTLTVQFSTSDDDQALYHALNASAKRAGRYLENQIRHLLRVAHGLRPVLRGQEIADLGLTWPQTLDQRVSKLESDITENAARLAQLPRPPKKTGRVLHLVPGRKDGEP